MENVISKEVELKAKKHSKQELMNDIDREMIDGDGMLFVRVRRMEKGLEVCELIGNLTGKELASVMSSLNEHMLDILMKDLAQNLEMNKENQNDKAVH